MKTDEIRVVTIIVIGVLLAFFIGIMVGTWITKDKSCEPRVIERFTSGIA